MAELKLEQLLDDAVILLWVAEKAIGERRRVEKACGYPEEYGNDKLLLQRLRTFLKVPQVIARVKELI